MPHFFYYPKIKQVWHDTVPDCPRWDGAFCERSTVSVRMIEYWLGGHKDHRDAYQISEQDGRAFLEQGIEPPPPDQVRLNPEPEDEL